jgi:hypothetical protein
MDDPLRLLLAPLHWLTLRRWAKRREAWRVVASEARAARRLSQRRDMRWIATYTPEMGE